MPEVNVHFDGKRLMDALCLAQDAKALHEDALKANLSTNKKVRQPT